MSTLSQFAGGGVKSVQTGYVSTLASTSGVDGDQDRAYRDTTISSVNVSKSVVFFDGGFGSGVVGARNPNSAEFRVPTARLTSPTNLRLSSNVAVTSSTFCGQWTVVEYA